MPPAPSKESLESIEATRKQLSELARTCERIFSELTDQKKISRDLTREIKQLGTRLSDPQRSMSAMPSATSPVVIHTPGVVKAAPAPTQAAAPAAPVAQTAPVTQAAPAAAQVDAKQQEQVNQEHLRELLILQSKVQRLANQLDEAESERDKYRSLAKRLEETGGGLRTNLALGIDKDDPDRERKLGALKNLFDENVRLRQHMKKRTRKRSGGSASMTVTGIKKISVKPLGSAGAKEPPPLTIVRKKAA